MPLPARLHPEGIAEKRLEVRHGLPAAPPAGDEAGEARAEVGVAGGETPHVEELGVLVDVARAGGERAAGVEALYWCVWWVFGGLGW